MLEQNFTQSDWWVGFELSASEIATQFPTTITKTQTVKTQVDHWWTCIWTLLWYFFLQNLLIYVSTSLVSLHPLHHIAATLPYSISPNRSTPCYGTGWCSGYSGCWVEIFLFWWLRKKDHVVEQRNSNQVWILGECYTTDFRVPNRSALITFRMGKLATSLASNLNSYNMAPPTFVWSKSNSTTFWGEIA